LAAASPIRFAGSITARLLLASGELDPMIPPAQNTALKSAVRAAHGNAYVDVDLLPRGTTKFVHTGTTAEALDVLHRREAALVAGIGGRLVPPVLKLF
jgi:hypothetical protein